METISIQPSEVTRFTAKIPCTFHRFEPIVLSGKDGTPVVCYSIYPTDVAFSD